MNDTAHTSPVWQHRWLHADPMDSYSIWRENRLAHLSDEEQVALYIERTGTLPASCVDVNPLEEVTLYATDPEIKRLQAWLEPFVPLPGGPFDDGMWYAPRYRR